MKPLVIHEPGPQHEVKEHGTMPLFRLGFRPFYLLAAAFAAVSIPVWLAKYFGMMESLRHVNLLWHMHEMTFGFAIAVIIGFLYTAGRNWTGQNTPHGKALAAIAGLWIAGRLAMLLAGPGVSSTFAASIAAAVDLAFIPAAAWPLYLVLKRANNRRNLFLIGLLMLLTLTNAAYHMAVLGWLNVSPVSAIHAAVLIIVLIESAIGGRVIPMFTANAVPGTHPVVHARRDRIALALTAAASVAWIAGLPSLMTASLCLAAAAAQALRLAGWKPFSSVHNPLLWILHLSYAWIPIGLALLGLSAIGKVPASAAIHALVVGAMAGLIMGMITRTALGHTGRPLKAGWSETVMYALVQLGALARVAASLDIAVPRNELLWLASACWAGAFCLYIAVYAPYLLQARLDGKEG